MKSKIISTLIALILVSDGAYAQRKIPVGMKKVSQFKSEKERCFYIIELADAEFLKAGAKWSDVKAIFDLEVRDYLKDEKDGYIIASLSDPWPKERLEAAANDGSAIQQVNWYVRIDVLRGQIRKFYMTNSHK